MAVAASSSGGQGSLFYLANEEGGDVFAAGGNLDEQLEIRLRRDAVTYLLTFHPDSAKSDGSYHRLKVKSDLPIEIFAYVSHEPVLLPPFFVEPPARWFMVREKPPEELESEWLVYPFTIDGEPFVPAEAPVHGRDEEIEPCLDLLDPSWGDTAHQQIPITIAD